MEQKILVIHDVMNYHGAEKGKKMQYASLKKITETDPYWIVPHAFKIRDLKLYQQYRKNLHRDARRYWDSVWDLSDEKEKHEKSSTHTHKYCMIL